MYTLARKQRIDLHGTKKKFNANVQITHSPSKSIRPIYNLCKLNAKQIIENHLSKSDKYNFAFDDLNNHIGQKKDIKKLKHTILAIFQEIML